MTDNTQYNNALHSLWEQFGQTFHQGQTIFFQGTHGDEIFFILKGRVQVLIHEYLDIQSETYARPGGKTRVLCELTDGSIFGEMAVMEDGYLRSATVVALEETRMLAMKRDELYANLETYPSLAIRLFHIFVNRMRRMDSQLKKQLGYDSYAELMFKVPKD